MSTLRLGDIVVGVDARGVGDLAEFLDRICASGPPGLVTHRMAVRRDAGPSLIVDDSHRTIALSLSPGPAAATTQIGFLQALARGLAYIERSTDDLALLHGSALTTSGGAVAVLDGGLGQGKTSLAMGLARRHGLLLVDEFAFARTGPNGVVLAAAPTLPWHLRADMAPYLAPSPACDPLLYPDQLQPLAGTSTTDAALRLILVPDRGIEPGDTVRVVADQAPDVLRYAVTDHLTKLADPRLDHVSIFATSEQVTDPTGRPLADRVAPPVGRDTVLNMLAAIPTYRVGIGTPADLPASVAAAGPLIDAMAA